MKRIVRIVLVGAALAAAALIAARAFAHGPGNWKKHVEQRVDGALDAAKATPEQRASVHAAVEHVITTIGDAHGSRGADFGLALSLFEADRVDTAAIAKQRAAHEAAAKKISDAVVQAIFDTHDALTATQRRALADWVRTQHAEHAGGGVRGELMKRMVSAHIDEALDAVKVSDAQRATAHAARDRVFGVLEELHKTRAGDLDRALAIFTADKLDAKAIDALRAEHMAQMKRAGDAIVQALTELHDTLDGGQRHALVEWVKAHRPAQHWDHHG